MFKGIFREPSMIRHIVFIMLWAGVFCLGWSIAFGVMEKFALNIRYLVASATFILGSALIKTLHMMFERDVAVEIADDRRRPVIEIENKNTKKRATSQLIE